jgi:hypothetical protein
MQARCHNATHFKISNGTKVLGIHQPVRDSASCLSQPMIN